MKKQRRTNSIYLLSAALTLGALSCTKEEIKPANYQMGTHTTHCCHHITYMVNGQRTAVCIKDKNEMHQLIRGLVILSNEGNRIIISIDELTPSEMATKDVLKIETTNRDELEKWIERMLSDGYEVYWEYDASTGTYRGIATKK